MQFACGNVHKYPPRLQEPTGEKPEVHQASILVTALTASSIPKAR